MKKILPILCMIVSIAFVSFGCSKKEETILFTTFNYGNQNEWSQLWKDLGEEFYQETGVRVQHEIINWAQAREKMTTWQLGGDAPDVADMFWAKTFADLGPSDMGTMPIEDYLDEYIPDFSERILASALGDVTYKGHIYGIPWRIDARSFVYRKDFLQEAGIQAEDIITWEDLVDAGEILTLRDEDGVVSRYGVGFLATSQELYSWAWQAGADLMNPDFSQVTIDTPEMHQAVQFLQSLVHEHKIASADSFTDPSYDGFAEFAAGRIAIIPFSPSVKTFIENNAPHLIDVIGIREPIVNQTQDTFMGGGYFSVNHQTKHLEASLKWMEFISRPENMAKLGIYSGNLVASPEALQDPYYQENWYFKGHVEALPYGRSTQHPHPAWGGVTNDQPGAPFYDLMVNAVGYGNSVNDEILRSQELADTLVESFE